MILIRNGRVMDPNTGLDEVLDIEISDGKITAMGQLDADGKDYERIIDASGLVLSPGFMDVHVHFRDPGFTYKEDIITGAAAAACGGYTTVVCMANTSPAIDCKETLTEIRNREAKLPIHVLQAANVTIGMKGEKLVDMEELKNSGAASFTDDGLPIMSEDLLTEALEKCKELDAVLSLHEEDPAYIKSPGVNAGKVASHFHVGGADEMAEITMVERDIRLNATVGAKLDIQHMSSAKTVELVRKTKERGEIIYGEVTPQHIALTEEDLLRVGTLGRVNPPIRTEEDRLALIAGLKDGTIDVIATDHAPHSSDEKKADMAHAPSGMIGLETALGVCMKYLVKEEHLSLMEFLSKVTVNPAKMYDIDAGRLYLGGPADLCIFDPDEKWIVREDGFHSKSSNSPFIGEELIGRVHYTICEGRIVYEA